MIKASRPRSASLPSSRIFAKFRSAHEQQTGEGRRGSTSSPMKKLLQASIEPPFSLDAAGPWRCRPRFGAAFFLASSAATSGRSESGVDQSSRASQHRKSALPVPSRRTRGRARSSVRRRELQRPAVPAAPSANIPSSRGRKAGGHSAARPRPPNIAFPSIPLSTQMSAASFETLVARHARLRTSRA